MVICPAHVNLRGSETFYILITTFYLWLTGVCCLTRDYCQPVDMLLLTNYKAVGEGYHCMVGEMHARRERHDAYTTLSQI